MEQLQVLELIETADPFNIQQIREETGMLVKQITPILHRLQEAFLIYAIHRNDFIYKAHEYILKEMAKKLTKGLEYDHEPLQYLLIDGEFHGASVGHFRNGSYDLNDIVCDLPDAESHKNEIVEAIRIVNYDKMPSRFMGIWIDIRAFASSLSRQIFHIQGRAHNPALFSAFS